MLVPRCFYGGQFEAVVNETYWRPRLTASKLRIIFNGIATVIRAIKGYPFVLGKGSLLVSVALVSPEIFNVGIHEQTPFVLLAFAFLLFILSFIVLIREAGKWDRIRGDKKRKTTTKKK